MTCVQPNAAIRRTMISDNEKAEAKNMTMKTRGEKHARSEARKT